MPHMLEGGKLLLFATGVTAKDGTVKGLMTCEGCGFHIV